MSEFIKLNSLTINSREIILIERTDNLFKIYVKYDITPNAQHIIYTSGGIQVYKNIIEINKSKNFTEYILLEEWIKNL
jgi:hypothetical protein